MRSWFQHQNSKSRFGSLFLSLLGSLISNSMFAGSLGVTWDPVQSSALVGYRINYGATSGVYTQSVNVGSLTRYVLPNLTEGLTYYLVVVGYDAIGVEGMPSAEASGVVLASSAVTANSVASSSAVITWTTNKPSSSQVDYGTTTNYGSMTPLDGNLVTAHSQTLTNLASGSTWHFRVRSTDEGGSTTISVDYTFTTQTANSSLLSVNSGGPAAGGFGADANFAGGSSYVTVQPINTTELSNPGPEAVYQSERFGTSFAYTFSNLTPGSPHYVRLHFSENSWTSLGQRKFFVAINGSRVLADFDILAAAGAQYKGAIQQFRAVASGNGRIVVQFFQGTVDVPKSSGIELIPLNQISQPVAQLNSGGLSVGGYEADGSVSGGQTYTYLESIDMAAVIDPAPQEVYQTERYGGDFTYTISNLILGKSYRVRLHFAESYWNNAGQRRFNVAINGRPILQEFDIIAAAGGRSRAAVQEFLAVPDSNGRIVIRYTAGSADVATANGIQVIPVTPALSVNAGGPAAGSFNSDGFFSGGRVRRVDSAVIDTSALMPGAPHLLYKSERNGDMTYTIPDLVPDGSYAVRLHFAEILLNGPGQRKFSVAINATRVLNDFDIVAAAGGANKAVVHQFAAVANTTGQIIIQFSAGSIHIPKVSAIEVLR